MLASTLYFKGLWVNRFPPERTMEKPFWVHAAKREKLVKTMRQTTGLRHAKLPEHGFAALELPMSGVSPDFTMLILLPDDRNGVGAVEQKLTLAMLEDTVSRLTATEVAVSLPKFSFSLGGDFTATLSALGLDRMFSASLAGTGAHVPAGATVRERLTERSHGGSQRDRGGSHGGDGSPRGSILRRQTRRASGDLNWCGALFIADLPFVFFIRHQPSGLVLVMGRVGEPVT